MKMNELFEFKDAILTVHLPQDLDHPQSDWIRKEDHEQDLCQKDCF